MSKPPDDAEIVETTDEDSNTLWVHANWVDEDGVHHTEKLDE